MPEEPCENDTCIDRDELARLRKGEAVAEAAIPFFRVVTVPFDATLRKLQSDLGAAIDAYLKARP